MRPDVSFCVLGKFGSGKTSVVGYLKERLPDHKVVTSSDMWNKLAGKKMTHYEAMVFQKKMVDKNGEEYFAKQFVKIIDDMKKREPDASFIIDGVRTKERLDSVKKYFGNGLVTIGISSDKSVRKKRLGTRDGSSGTFEDREMRETKQFVDLDHMIESSDFRIENNFGDKESLFEKIDDMLAKIK